MSAAIKQGFYSELITIQESIITEGLFRGWYENGKLSFEENYVNGIGEGRFRWWFENGQLNVILYSLVINKESINDNW